MKISILIPVVFLLFHLHLRVDAQQVGVQPIQIAFEREYNEEIIFNALAHCGDCEQYQVEYRVSGNSDFQELEFDTTIYYKDFNNLYSTFHLPECVVYDIKVTELTTGRDTLLTLHSIPGSYKAYARQSNDIYWKKENGLSSGNVEFWQVSRNGEIVADSIHADTVLWADPNPPVGCNIYKVRAKSMSCGTSGDAVYYPWSNDVSWWNGGEENCDNLPEEEMSYSWVTVPVTDIAFDIQYGNEDTLELQMDNLLYYNVYYTAIGSQEKKELLLLNVEKSDKIYADFVLPDCNEYNITIRNRATNVDTTRAVFGYAKGSYTLNNGTENYSLEWTLEDGLNPENVEYWQIMKDDQIVDDQINPESLLWLDTQTTDGCATYKIRGKIAGCPGDREFYDWSNSVIWVDASCDATAMEVDGVIVNKILSVNSLIDKTIKIYPNPVSEDGLNIKLEGTLEEVYLIGQNGSISKLSFTQSKIELPDQTPQGIYILQLQVDSKKMVYKIVVE